MSTVYRPKWPFYSCWNHIGLLGTGFMQVMSLGRAPRTKETLPDFLKWRRVTRHPLVFRGLTDSQQTPGFGASHFKSWVATLQWCRDRWTCARACLGRPVATGFLRYFVATGPEAARLCAS